MHAKFLYPSHHRRLTLLLLGLLEHLLDDLLLLNQESTDDAVLDAVGASRSAVRTLDGLLGARDGGILVGAEGRDTCELGTAVLYKVKILSQVFQHDLTYTALGGSALLLDVQVAELTTGCLDDANLLAPGVVWRTSPLPTVSSPFQFSPDFRRCKNASGMFRCDVRR